jgi:GxxExxY protein
MRLRAEGFSNVQTQVPVKVVHDGFSKEYFFDLIAEDALYELKTVVDLAPEHDAQLLHYAMLLDVGHAKLLNFRSGKVQGRLRYNALNEKERRRWIWEDRSWCPVTTTCALLKQWMRGLLDDWGAFLDFRLYNEALIRFCGGEAVSRRRVPVVHNGVNLGMHVFNFHPGNIPFVVTAMNEGATNYRTHLERLGQSTSVPALQWINLNHHTVELITL